MPIHSCTSPLPVLDIKAMQTVSPCRVTDPRRVRKVSAKNPIVSGILQSCLHVVLYYQSASEEDSAWLWAGWAVESLARALDVHQPLLAGRLRHRMDGDGDLEIVSNDCGVRLVQAHIATTLSSFLELKEKEEAETQLVAWEGIDEQSLQFSPLFYVQVTNFQCGGYSIGISCSLLLADLLVNDDFLGNWAIAHRNIASSNNGSQKPLFYLPNMKSNGSSPASMLSSSPRTRRGQTTYFKVAVPNKKLDSEMCKSLALHCVEETESRLGRDMHPEFILFVKGNTEAITVDKCSKQGFAKPQSSFDNEINWAGWDDSGLKELAFREGNKPVHVSHWFALFFDELVMAIPSLYEDTLGLKILVSVPKDKEH